MKKLLLLPFLLFAITAIAQPELTLDETNATVKFYFVKKKVPGSVDNFEATVKFDPSNLPGSSISGSVDASTINTGNKMRDKHLRSEDYFHVEKYPNFTFKSTSITKTSKGYEMKGTMTIKGIEKPVTWTFTYKDGKFVARTIINPDDYDIPKDSEVKIEVQVSVQ